MCDPRVSGVLDDVSDRIMTCTTGRLGPYVGLLMRRVSNSQTRASMYIPLSSMSMQDGWRIMLSGSMKRVLENGSQYRTLHPVIPSRWWRVFPTDLSTPSRLVAITHPPAATTYSRNPSLCSVPCPCRTIPGGRPQAGSESERPVRAPVRPGGELLVLNGQQELRHYLGRRHALRVPARPQELHQGHQDGLRGDQVRQGPQGPDCVFEGLHVSHALVTLSDKSLACV